MSDLCLACQHSAKTHCDGLGRCNAMTHNDDSLSLQECNCPAFTTAGRDE